MTAGAHASKKDGQSLKFLISYPKDAMGSQSWFKSAKFDIPKQLPVELHTIQQACTSEIFETDRAKCPSGSIIGHAVVHTQVLPVPLEGPVYFVSFGNLKFPDAIILLSGYGINIRLTGETFINHTTGVTSATFPANPDVPFESIEVTLPTGTYSEFGANLPHESYDFCGQKLTMPVEFKAQNGLELKQSTTLTISGCPTTISLSSHALKGRTLTLTVYAPAAGKLKLSGKGINATTKTATGQENVTFTVDATKHGSYITNIKLAFTPTKGKRQSKTLRMRV